MKFLKSVSRLLTIPVLGKERRKRARLEVEEALKNIFIPVVLSRRRRLICRCRGKIFMSFLWEPIAFRG